MFTVDDSAGVRTANLFHSMRDITLSADGALLVCVNPVTMFVTMTLQAIGDSVIDIVSEFRMLAPFFDVMGLQYAATLTAFLASVVIASNHSVAPLFVFCSTLLYISFSCALCFAALIVGLLIALFHGVFVCGFAFIGRQISLSTFRDIRFTGWARVRALAATVGLYCSFGLKNFLAIRASLNHVLSFR